MTSIQAIVRLFRRHSGLSLLSILTLGLGIGLATVLFSIVYGLVLRPLPFPGGDRLVAVQLEGDRIPAGRFLRWREETAAFEILAAHSSVYSYVTGTEGGTRTYAGAEISPDFFRLVDISPALGRSPTPEDSKPGAVPVAWVSHQVWQEAFGGRPDVLGQSVRISRELFTVVGVMPEGFQFPQIHGVWMPLTLSSDLAPDEGRAVEVVGRLGEGVSPAQAQEELNLRLRGMDVAPGTPAPTVRVEPFVAAHTDPTLLRTVPLMALAVLGVLLIACVNVANLFLGRILEQRHELAVAAALGASRFRLAVRTLGEILVITTLAGLLGLLLAQGGIRLFNGLMEPAGVFRTFWAQVKMEPAVALFTVPVAMLACILAAVLPWIHVLRTDPAVVLREYSAGSGHGVGPVTRGLVVAEVALACTLLILAGLMIHSVGALRAADYGFEPEDLLTARVSVAQDPDVDDERARAFFDTLAQTLETDGRLERVGFASSIPTRVSFWAPLAMEGGLEGPERIRWLVVSEGYFDALDVEILTGRLVVESEGDSEAVLVNASFAALFPGQVLLGRKVKLGGDDAPWRTVVGVVQDVTMGPLGEEESQAMVYLPLSQMPRPSMEMLVETKGDPVSLIPTLEASVRALDPLATVFYVIPMEEVLRRRHWLHEALAALFTVFGFVALTLSVVGLGGVIAVIARSRRWEYAIRLALGAEPSRILAGVLGSAVLQAGLGLGVGLGLAIGLSRIVSSRVFGVETSEPTIYVGVVLVVLLAAVLASLTPAIRAARTDPGKVLRETGSF